MFILLAVLFFTCALGEKLGEAKVTICHVPNGDISKVRPISIGVSAKEDHISHGDFDQHHFPDPEISGATIITCSDPCTYDVCKNGATCSYIENPPFPYTCNCVDGWIGPNCDINPCLPNPCQNSGTCSSTPSESNDYTCNCAPGWSGSNCDINPCIPNPCLNSGTCSATPSESSDFTCTCSDGFYGSICADNSICNPPCGSGQTCSNQICATVGQLFFRMTWNNPNIDLDIYVTTPNGKSIYFVNVGPNLNTDYGYLEIDSVWTGGTTENIYWSDSVVAPSGNYHVCVNDFTGSNVPLPVTLTYGYPGNIQSTSYTTVNTVDVDDVCSPTSSNFVLTFSYP